MNKFVKLAAPILLLSLVPAQAAQAAPVHSSGHGVKAVHVMHIVHGDGSWSHAVDRRHDRFQGGYYWREIAGITARWNARDDRWERRAGHGWQHWNGHRWVA
ncbi:hypothetical protein [Streptacidiphilus anmyonensis]|uniref:hypothetical protein n=1 Tax=Streptacidiphilus anmyonensis TaxID=405782 RepID=UPI0005A801A9|nr:hypothetical protein [Streptacidiphilus anmyonensis]